MTRLIPQPLLQLLLLLSLSPLQNMLEHEDEIYSRPARTWFQTEKQKKEAAAAAAAAAEGRTVLEDSAGGRLLLLISACFGC